MINNLKASKRETKTTGELNALRAKGFVPAVLYGGTSPNLKLSIEEKLLKDLNSETFLSTVIDLDVDGKKEKVIPRDISFHVISDKPTHIDFMRIVKGSKIILEIPVIFKNNDDSPGLKKGGVLNIVRRRIELECVAENIPGDIEVDLKGLDIGASIKISSVKLPENTKPTITDRDFVVATIAPPTIVKEPEKPAEETAEGAEGEAAATTEGGEATPTEATKDGEAPKKEDKGKGKDQASDKKSAAKPAGDKKQEKK
jgi:large subunit ribosomal protein L25